MSRSSLPCALLLAGALACGSRTEPDTTAPTLTRTDPENGSTSVALTTALTVAFSEPMAPASLKLAVTPAADLHDATWNADSTEATLLPWIALPAATSFSVQVEGTDVAGNALSGLSSFVFTTEDVADTTPPTLVQSVPATGATNVGLETVISLTFSEALDTDSFGVAMTPELALGAPEWSAGNRTVSFPAAPGALAPSTAYELSLTASDTSNNALAGTSKVTFTTSAGSSGAPQVLSISPSPAATNVSTNTSLVITFSRAMNKASVESALSTTPAATLFFTWNQLGTAVTCLPSAALAASTTYSVALAATAKDTLGVALGSTFNSSFTTGSGADSTRPTLTASLPASGAVGQASSTPLQLTFSEAMNPTSVEQSLSASTGTTTVTFNPGTWTADKTQVTLTPKVAVAQGATVSWRVTTGAKDLAGNALAADATGTYGVSKQAVAALVSIAALDGAVNSSGGAQAVDTTTSYAGDGSNDVTHVLMLTFDIGRLPPTTDRIVKATLYLQQASVSGTPYAGSAVGTDCMTKALGCLYVDGVDYGPTLEGSDFATPTLMTPHCSGTPAVCTQAPEVAYVAGGSTPNTKDAPATRKVQDDFANRATRGNRAQFRVHFYKATDNDQTRDTANIYTGDYTGTCNSTAPGGACRPTLQITYDYH